MAGTAGCGSTTAHAAVAPRREGLAGTLNMAPRAPSNFDPISAPDLHQNVMRFFCIEMKFFVVQSMRHN